MLPAPNLPLELRLAGILAALLALVLAVHWVLAGERQRQLQLDQAHQAAAAAAFNARAQAQGASWAASTQKAVQDGHESLVTLAAATSRVGAELDRAVQRVRDVTLAAGSRGCAVPGDPAAAASGAAAASAAGMSADLFRRAGELAAIYARQADVERIAHATCVGSYPVNGP